VIGAAVDVGSNSVHLLVARVTKTGLDQLLDESELIGLGDVVDEQRMIPPDAIDRLVASLTNYRDKARALGATSVTFMGTEPLRRAGNSDEVAAAVEQSTGVPLRIVSRDEEGELTFLGVTGGHPVDGSLLVVDIGGGSTEVMLHEAGRGLTVSGLPFGSARLWREYVRHDPPTSAEIDELRQASATAVSALAHASPQRAVFVGGTATNLVKLAPLAIASFENVYRTLAETPAAEIAERFRVRLRRAHQLASGAALAEQLLLHFALTTADVTDASLRDGAIIAAARRG
jgi:exopolyphosphatase/pppGpp-phosphohydrolase